MILEVGMKKSSLKTFILLSLGFISLGCQTVNTTIVASKYYDNKITARELHAYVEQNVVQQSSGSQTPELQGDKDRVLVQFN